jgi:polyisoprenyl-phosphate glycosyltransferase
MQEAHKISVVSPVYKAGNIIPELVRRLREVLQQITPHYEIILVEDGSGDNSAACVEEECRKDRNVKGVLLSRNFGQHYAITAGLEHASGDFVVVIDCDLQDNPDYIKEMYALALQGNEVIYTRKKSRKHSFFKNITAHLFFWAFNKLTGGDTDANGQVGAFSMLSSRVVHEFRRINDFHRHYLMVVRLLGFKSTYLEIEHQKRHSGRSSYTFRKLVSHAISGITSQSVRLLHFSIILGFCFFALSMIGAVYLIVSYVLQGAFPGYTSLMIVILLSTGLILISIGVMGIYVGKIFEQSKGRPLYIVDKKINF